MIEKRITGVREFIVARRECEVDLRGGWGSEPAPTPAEEKFVRPKSRGSHDGSFDPRQGGGGGGGGSEYSGDEADYDSGLDSGRSDGSLSMTDPGNLSSRSAPSRLLGSLILGNIPALRLSQRLVGKGGGGAQIHMMDSNRSENEQHEPSTPPITTPKGGGFTPRHDQIMHSNPYVRDPRHDGSPSSSRASTPPTPNTPGGLQGLARIESGDYSEVGTSSNQSIHSRIHSGEQRSQRSIASSRPHSGEHHPQGTLYGT